MNDGIRKECIFGTVDALPMLMCARQVMPNPISAMLRRVEALEGRLGCV